MKKNKLIIALASVSLIGTMVIGGSLAYFTDQDTVENVITMGKVAGNLTEPAWDENNPEGVIDKVQPGDSITKDPTLTVDEDSEDAYARFHVTFSDLTEEQFNQLKFYKTENSVRTEVLLDSNHDFYVQQVMGAGDTYILFDEVVIPKEWNNDMAKQTFHLFITADLVQADNFDDQLEINNGVITGWGNVDIQPAN